MTTEHTGANNEQTTGFVAPPPGPAFDAPPAAAAKPAAKRMQVLKVAGGAGLAAVAAGAVFVGASALSGNATTANALSQGPGGGPGGPPGLGDNQGGGMPGNPGGMPVGQGGGGGVGAALHGQFVVSDGNGGYITEETQTGKVTELTATSITVLSTDGYSRSYTVTANTVTGVATGHTVRVLATVSGQTATASRVVDETTGTRQNGGTVTN
jgi:hypothetical protein